MKAWKNSYRNALQKCQLGLWLAGMACVLLVGCRPAPAKQTSDEDLAQIRSHFQVAGLGYYQQQVSTPTPAPQYYRSALLPLFSGPAEDAIVGTPKSPDLSATPSSVPENQPSQSPPPSAALDGEFFGIDFSPGSPQITLRIELANRLLNQGQPLEISFLPGSQCLFGDGQACVNLYSTPEGQPVIYLTIHSGVGGQAQGFRNLVEGTGFNSAGFTLDMVEVNLQNLTGAKITLIQGRKSRRKLELAAAGRVPPQGLAAYFQASPYQALSLAAHYDPALNGFSHPGGPLLIFETCGWNMPGESRPAGTPSTSSSVYIGVIQRRP